MSFLPTTNARLLELQAPPVETDSYSEPNPQPDPEFDKDNSNLKFLNGADAYLVPPSKTKNFSSDRVDFVIDRTVLLPASIGEIDIDYRIRLAYPQNSDKVMEFKVKSFELIYQPARDGYYQVIGAPIGTGDFND